VDSRDGRPSELTVWLARRRHYRQRNGGGVHQRQHLCAAWGRLSQPPQRGLHQRREVLQPGVVLALWCSSRGNRCPIRLAAARSQCRSSSKCSSTCATAMHTSSASVTSASSTSRRIAGEVRKHCA
jgi:hypothetical protein